MRLFSLDPFLHECQKDISTDHEESAMVKPCFALLGLLVCVAACGDVPEPASAQTLTHAQSMTAESASDALCAAVDQPISCEYQLNATMSVSGLWPYYSGDTPMDYYDIACACTYDLVAIPVCEPPTTRPANWDPSPCPATYSKPSEYLSTVSVDSYKSKLPTLQAQCNNRCAPYSPDDQWQMVTRSVKRLGLESFVYDYTGPGSTPPRTWSSGTVGDSWSGVWTEAGTMVCCEATAKSGR